MKGVDYTKALNKEREYFSDTIKKNNDSSEKRIRDNNERNEGIVKKQRENFIEDKAELESNYQKNIEKLDAKTAASLQNDNDKYLEDRLKERESFLHDATLKRKDFDQRLNDITNSYKKSFQSERDIHKDLQDTTKKKYDANIVDTRNHSDAQLKEYREEMSGAGASLKDQYNRERQQLVRSQEDHIAEVHKMSGKKTADMKEHLRADLKKSKEIQAADLEQQKQYTGDRMTNLQNKYEDRYQKMAKDYSVRSDALVESQQIDAKKKNKENQDNLIDARRNYNKQLRLIDLEKRRRDNGSGEFAQVMERQQGLKDDSVHQKRFVSLKNQLSDAQRDYQEQSSKDRDAFSQTLKSESIENTARLDRKLNEANADKIITVSKEREDKEANLASRADQNLVDRKQFEQQLALEKSNSKERQTKLKENFSSAMKQLEERNKAGMEDVTKASNMDKDEFIKKVNAARTKEMFEVKREFNKLMDSTVQEYEQRLGNYQRDNDYLKLTMDQKIQNLTDQTDKQLESQRTLFDDRRSADIKNHQILVDQKEHHLKTAMNQMNVGYQKKIDKMQLENESRLKLLTNDYENKLKELKAMTSKELAMSQTNQQIELDRVKRAFEDEKTRTIQAYESQISSIKTGHREQMDQMKDFKRLS